MAPPAPALGATPTAASRRWRRAWLHLALVVVLGACAAGGTGEGDTPVPEGEDPPALEIGAARAAEPVAGSSQIVLDITNPGGTEERLVEVSTPAAVGIEIHQTAVEDGRTTMRQLDEVVLPAGETVRFRPGGLHLMVVAPDESVVLGGTFPATLRFASSPERTVDVEVVDQLDLAESTFDQAPTER